MTDADRGTTGEGMDETTVAEGRQLPEIIQGGMGVAISDYRLARAVARSGGLGVVSGTGIALITVARLQEGDPGGDVRRSLERFPDPDVADEILSGYFVPGGIPKDEPYRRPKMWDVMPDLHLVRLTTAAAFVEVDLAREGHAGPVGINLLEKIQLPHLATLYGAMLAGVDVVIMGAGMPLQVPEVLVRLARHEPTTYRLDVEVDGGDEPAETRLEPATACPRAAAAPNLDVPLFLPIVSTDLLARAMVKRASGPVDGFVVEAPVAGGHNAPPRRKNATDDRGQPVYGERDRPDLQRLRDLGLPFWMAGGYGHPGGLSEARAAGARGIQVGTLFAFCAESGMASDLRAETLQRVLDGGASVLTSSVASPTGYPFKVVELPDTLAESRILEGRRRRCDLGFLRTAYREDDGSVGFRCPAEPETAYRAKGGDPADTEGRVCLCNALSATAGYPQRLRGGGVEPPVVTAGDALPDLAEIVADKGPEYTASDVIAWLRGR